MEKKEIYKIPLNELNIFDKNPRFISKKNINLIEISRIGKDIFDEEECIKQIWKNEGDFKDYFELMNSIINNGYNSDFDWIYVLKNSSNKYIVLEGNRRISILKILKNVKKYIKLFEEYIDKKTNDSSEEYNYEINESPNELNKNKKNNINKIIDILKNYKNDNDDQEILAKVYFDPITKEKENLIWKTLFKKSVAEEKGKRNWSRLKYFTDLVDYFLIQFDELNNMYKDESNNINEAKKLTKDFFDRKDKTFDLEFDSAIWCYLIINIYIKNNPNSDISNNIKISSIELSRSSIKFLDQGNEISLKKYLGIEIDYSSFVKRNFLESIKLNKKYDIDSSKLSTFLVESFIPENKYTTRGWKNEYITDLYEFLVGEDAPNYKKTITNQQIKEDIENLNKLSKIELTSIKCNEKYCQDRPQMRIICYAISLYNNEIITQINYWKRNGSTPGKYPYASLSFYSRVLTEMLCHYIFLNFKTILNVATTLIEEERLQDINNIEEMKKFINNFINKDYEKTIESWFHKPSKITKSFSLISSNLETKTKSGESFIKIIENDSDSKLKKLMITWIQFYKNNKGEYNNYIHTPYILFTKNKDQCSEPYLDSEQIMELQIEYFKIVLELLKKIIE